MPKIFLNTSGVLLFLSILFIPTATLAQNSVDQLQAPPDYSQKKSSASPSRVLRPRERLQRLKETLKQLHGACKVFWKDQGSDQDCRPVTASQPKYGFKIPRGVTVKASGSEKTFSAAAIDSKIKVIYGLDASGNIGRISAQSRPRRRSGNSSPALSDNRSSSSPKRDVKAMMGGSEICEEDVGRVKKLYTELYKKDPMQCGDETITEAVTDWKCKKRSPPQGPCKKNIVGCSMPVTCTLDAMGEYKRFEQVLAVARKNDPKFWEFFPNQSKFVKLLGNVYTACQAHWDKNGNSADCKRDAFPKKYFEKIPKQVGLEFSGDRSTYYATATDKKTGYKMVMQANGRIEMKKPQ